MNEYIVVKELLEKFLEDYKIEFLFFFVLLIWMILVEGEFIIVKYCEIENFLEFV